MLLQIGIAVLILISIFVIFVATRKGQFLYERSGLIAAPAEKIFPYLKSFQLGSQWSPYDKMDPKIKKSFYKEDGEVGSVMNFEGNHQVGSGRLEILNIVPNQMVEIRLKMFKPFEAENNIQYRLTSENGLTRFTWLMSGDSKFVGKLMNVFIDVEKLVADQFTVGINDLSAIVERSERNHS